MTDEQLKELKNAAAVEAREVAAREKKELERVLKLRRPDVGSAPVDPAVDRQVSTKAMEVRFGRGRLNSTRNAPPPHTDDG